MIQKFVKLIRYATEYTDLINRLQFKLVLTYFVQKMYTYVF